MYNNRIVKTIKKIFNTILIMLFFVFVGMMFWATYKDAKNEEYNKNLYHYVTFDSDGGTMISSQKVLHGSSCSRPEEIPIKEGKTFVGWYDSSEMKKLYGFFLPVEDDITLYAKWEDNTNLKSIIITFDTGYDSKVSSMVVKKGESKSLPKLTRDGYIFKGWLNDNKIVTSTNEVKNSKVLTAYWEKVEESKKIYKITFDSNGGSNINQVNVEEGKTLKKPSAPTKKGYVFVGWYLNNKLFNFNTIINSNIKLVAKWEKDLNDNALSVLKVTFDSAGGSNIETQNIEYGKKAKYPKEPSKKGYTFVGWYLGNDKYDFDKKVTKNIILVAHYKKEQEKEDVFVVTFDSNGGSKVTSQNVISGQKAVKPNNPTRNDYIFEGWYLGNNQYNFNSLVKSNITLKAKWSKVIKTFVVTFDSAGGSIVASQIVDENKTVPKPSDPVKKGYTFTGWYLDNKKFDFSTKITREITLVAHYQKDPVSSEYTVTFDSAGGSSIASQSVVDGGTATKPKNPTKSGYTFIGWYYGNSVYNFNTPVTSNITLVAHYQNSQKFTVTFDSNGGSSVSSQSVTSGDTASKPKNPTKSGYTFDGWYKNGSLYNFNTPVTSNITLTANWIENGVSIPTLSYSKNKSGKWVFINNPEAIKPEHFADRSNRLLYRDSFSGNIEIYFEHSITELAYYAIRFYNPGTSNVTLSINKSGLSYADSTWTGVWRQYYSGENITRDTSDRVINSVVVEPKKVVYFYYNGSFNSFVVGSASSAEIRANKIRGGIDGILNLSSNGLLEFAALAYSTSYKNTDGATYPGNVETGSTIGVYTGYYDKMPELENDITFEINDTVSKGNNLKVKYNNKTYSSWLTNGSGAYLKKNGSSYDINTISETMKSDMINFKYKSASGTIYTAGSYPEYKDTRPGILTQYGISARSYNIANWAVHYNENIKIKNTGSSTRKVSFKIKNASNKMGSTCNSTIVSISSYGSYYKRISSGNDFTAWTVNITPGQTISVPTKVTLGGDSCGYVEKYLYVDQ